VNWVTQGSFAPPLVVVGVKSDSGAHTIVKGTGKFALNMLGKDHKGLAFTFFKPAKVEDGKLSGHAFHAGNRINSSLGNHAYTHSDFKWSAPQPIAITPENQNVPVSLGPPPYVTVNVSIWTEFASEEAKSGRSGYGVGTRPQDKPTLRFHERAHGEGWFTFLRNNPPPAFAATDGMLPAQYNAAVAAWQTAMRNYHTHASDFALQAGDCVGTLPTDKQLEGTGFTAAICHPP
jgi:hypothetical protein